ncbi:MAG: DUF4838 domain-containing protein [Clostridia bacterium]|nr:DUF4838 domain-containing protein [Clostridia bacterium]
MKPLEIVKNGRSAYHIVGSYFADECERYAASELQKYIYEATGTFVPYYSDICSSRSVEILVGYAARNAADYVGRDELETLGEEGYLLRSAEDGTVVICGKSSRGTLYGIYAFLSDCLGFRAFTSKVEKIDHVDQLVIPPLDVRKVPDFEYRDAYFRDAFDGAFAAKRMLNTSVADVSREKGGNVKFFSAHHTFESLLPSRVYFEAHPEYYALIDGKRVPTQPCLSNEDVVWEMTDNLMRTIKENPHARVFSVAQNDNQQYCRCEKCRAIDEKEGSPAGSMITFVNRVAEAVEAYDPTLLIHTFAYQYTRHAPRFVCPRKNVIVRLCNIECEWSEPFEVLAKRDPDSEAAAFLGDLAAWTRISDRVYIWDYAVNYANYLQPFANYYQMAENIRYYKRMGVRGVLMEGNFSYGGGASMDELKSYLISALLWDSTQDVDGLIDEFLKGVYGKGAPYLRDYINRTSASVKGHRLGIYDAPDAPYFSDEELEEYDRLFCLARDAAENDTVRERIEREHLAVEYTRVARTESDRERAEATDALAEKILRYRLTEIMERTNLYDSFDYVKTSRYAKARRGRYNMYYVVK